MSEVTAVPLIPVPRSTLAKLWIGIGLLIAAAFALAWCATSSRALANTSPEAFMAWNASQDGVETTASGLQYKVLEAGEGGEHPGPTDAALIDYEGRLTSGEVFDSGERVPLNLGQVVPGFGEGLQLMSRGARYRFWLPPALGYGDTPPQGTPITAESVLEFDVTLIDFISQAQLMQEMQQLPEGEQPPGVE